MMVYPCKRLLREETIFFDYVSPVWPNDVAFQAGCGGISMRLVGWLSLVTLCAAPTAHAAESVDVALVLVTDVSRHIDDSEFELEKQGYSTALTNPKVLAAIKGGLTGAIAVAYCRICEQLRSAHGAGLERHTR